MWANETRSDGVEDVDIARDGRETTLAAIAYPSARTVRKLYKPCGVVPATSARDVVIRRVLRRRREEPVRELDNRPQVHSIACSSDGIFDSGFHAVEGNRSLQQESLLLR